MLHHQRAIVTSEAPVGDSSSHRSCRKRKAVVVSSEMQTVLSLSVDDATGLRPFIDISTSGESPGEVPFNILKMIFSSGYTS
jgi:hypothetical protein